jgi:G2/mitotic-specific cyclin-B, other
MLVATKYEEIYPPLLKDFVYITDNKYKADEILDMEKSILFALDFDLQLTSSYRFLERFAKISKLDSVTYSLSQYLLELSLLDSKMN